jgi:hypothetical protein
LCSFLATSQFAIVWEADSSSLGFWFSLGHRFKEVLEPLFPHTQRYSVNISVVLAFKEST